MAAHGLAERRATLARLKTINGGRAWQGSVDDDDQVPRDPKDTGRVLPYIVVKYGAPIRSARDRNLCNPELGQPHILPATVYCAAGDYDSAQSLMAAVVELLVDWKASQTSDAWELKGGQGVRLDASSNAPTRYVEALFLESVVNQGQDPTP